jgi:hypothetical protein
MLPNKTNAEEYGHFIFLGFQRNACMVIIRDLYCEIYQLMKHHTGKIK